MRQTRTHSLLEVTLSTLTGYLVAFAANVVVLPWFGLHPSIGDSALIGLVFTAISIVRAYAFRRVFTHLTEAHNG